MTIEHIETAIIGAGQAGLATAYHLQRAGRPCLILDGNEHIGDNWRAQWDSLRLYSPARFDGLRQGCRSRVRHGPIRPRTRPPTTWRCTPNGSNSRCSR